MSRDRGTADPDAVTEEPPAERPATGRGAKSRRRRLAGGALRFVGWTLVAIALALTAIVAFLGSETARERGRTLIAARLGETLGREVSVGSVELDLHPLGLTVHDLVIPGPRPGDPPVARVPEAEVHADLSGLRDPRLHLRQLYLRRPEVRVVLDEGGGTNLPELRTSGGGGRVEVTIGSLVVEDGAVIYGDRRLPLDVDARSVLVRAGGRGAGSDIVLETRLASPQVTVELPAAQPLSGGVRGRLTVRSGTVEISAVSWAGPDLEADLEGRVEWGGGAPRVRLHVEADGRAELLSRLGWMDDPITGPWRLAGDFTSPAGEPAGGEPDDGVGGTDGAGPVLAAAGEWLFTGTLASAGVEVGGVGAAGLELAPLAARVTVDPSGVLARIERAGYAGGTVAGTVEVPTDGEPTRIETALDFERLAVAPLAEDWGLDLAGFTGSISGTSRYRFVTAEPLAGSGTVRLRVAGVERRPGALPLTGEGTIEVDAGRVRSEDLVLTARGQRVTATVDYDLLSERGTLGFELTTEELATLYRALPLPSEPGAAWQPTAGRGRLEGEAILQPAGLELALRADLADLRTAALAGERLAGGLRVTPTAIEELDLTATAGAGTLRAAGRLPLPTEETGAEETGEAPVDLALDLESWPAAGLAGLLPAGTPELAGPVSGRVTLGGGWESLTAEATLTAEPLSIAGLETDRVELAAVVTPSALTVEALRIALPAGDVGARGTVGLAEGPAAAPLRAEIEAPGLDLAAPPLSELFPGAVSGRLTVSATATGSLAEPAVELAVRGSELGVQGRPLGEDGGAEITATWEGGELAAEGSLLGLVSLAGGGRLELPGEGSPGAADLSFEVANEDLEGLLRTAGLALGSGDGSPWSSYGGRFDGRLRVHSDPLAEAGDGGLAGLTARLTLDALSIDPGAEAAVTNLEPVVATLHDGRLEVGSLYLGNDRGDELFVVGDIGLSSEDVPLDLRFQGRVDAVWAEALVPDSRLSGTVSVLGSVKGTAAAPQVNGQGEIDRGRAIFSGFPHSLEMVRATVFFNPDGTVVLDRLTARMAGGGVRAQGRIELPSVADDPVDYRFQARADGFGLRWPEGFLLRGDADLALIGRGGEQQVVGAVDLEHAFYLEDVSLRLTEILREALYRQRLQAEAADADLAATQINVSVEGPLRVRNNLADLRGDVDLLIRGTLAAPAVFGQVTLDPGGELTYAGNDYTVERGLLTFSNPYRIDPVIDLVASAEIDRYDITLQLVGTLERLDASFTSDPPLADLEVLQIVATGSAPAGTGLGGAGGGADADRSTGAAALLYGQAASLVTERVNTLFGFDRFQVNPGIGGDVGFAVGKRLSSDLYVTVSNDPVNEIDYLVQAEWRLSDQITLVLTQRGDDQYAVDLRWEKRF